MSGRSTKLVETPLGVFGVEATAAGVSRVWLPGDGLPPEEHGDGKAVEIARTAAAQISEYARGAREDFDLPLDWERVGWDQRRVLETLGSIAGYGQTVTYGELGERAGVEDPREIGVQMATNPLPIVVPCHRVVASDGLGGYGGGLALKRRLLELEGALPPSLDLGSL